jgi:glycolate oxidase
VTAEGTEVLRDGRWATDEATRAAHRTDRSGWTPAGSPSAVAFAESVDDVRAVLLEAGRTGTPVVPRGAGTGLAGGAAAPDGAIVLDVSRMRRILQLSPADELAVVEPGVITAELDAAAAAHGLQYAPDPASAAISSIGGNIATNAGGLRCAKYGVTRDSVLGLDVVLADGTLLHTGRRTVKGVAGYDLTGLFVGSEGTLGVIVGAALRLRPRPRTTATLAARFDDVAAAARGAAAITAAHLQPAVSELLDGATLTAIVAARTGAPPAPPTDGALLVVQTDGYGAELEGAAIEAVLAPLAHDVQRAADGAEAEALLADRRAALPALERLGRVLIEDIAVPRSRLGEAVEAVTAIGTTTGARVFTIAHAGDGNLHPLLVVDGTAESLAAAEAAAEEIFALALRLGGTVTGEHGVGVLKRRWLARELGEPALAVQHRLKAALDPRGLLNPDTGL